MKADEYFAMSDKARWAFLLMKAYKLDKQSDSRYTAWSMLKSDGGCEFMDAFINVALGKLNAYTHYGSKAIFEELRYRSKLKVGGLVVKVDNNYTATAARLAMSAIDELAGFFAVRGRCGQSAA